jgi:hypothetical protein
MEPRLADAAVARLESVGLIAAPGRGGYGSPAPEWQLTDLGKRMVNYCEGVAFRMMNQQQETADFLP